MGIVDKEIGNASKMTCDDVEKHLLLLNLSQGQ